MSRVCAFLAAVLVVAMALSTSGCSSSSKSSSISISLSPSSSQAIDQNQTVSFTATLMNDNSFKGISWSLNGPGSLSSLTGSLVTYNSPTTNLTSAQQVTVTAMSVADPAKRASVQITVNPVPQIPLQTLASGTVGVAYNQPITLTGGTAPFQWSVYNGPIVTGSSVGGAIPDGLRMDLGTGTISGTPIAGGTWYFETTTTDAAGMTAINGFLSIRIEPIATAGNPVPFLNQSLVPLAAVPGASSFTLNLTGTGFASGAAVNFNGAQLATMVVNSTHLTALVPAANIANAETAAVTVTNLAPGGGQSNVVYFQVAAPETAVSFAPAANAPLQVSEPYGVTSGDFNEDGKPDLAITANIRVYVFLGNGDGTFTPAAGSPVSVPSPPYDDFGSPYTGPIMTADFNHSGHLGLAVGEFQNEAVVTLLGKGDGTFTSSSAGFANALGQPTSALSSADFNADGNLDLAIANELSGQSPVVLGSGKGAFTAAGDISTGNFATGVTVGDVNADGKLDTIVASGGTTTYPVSGIAVSLGRGDGTFTLGNGSAISLGQNLSSIVTADFNGDGKLDVAVTDQDSNAVLILLGNGDGTFGSPTTIAVGSLPTSIIGGDFNNDGKLDLVTANFGDSTVSLLLGHGDGTFAQDAGSPYAVGVGPFQIVAADFNGDGKLDLATTNSMDGTVSILLQQ